MKKLIFMASLIPALAFSTYGEEVLYEKTAKIWWDNAHRMHLQVFYEDGSAVEYIVNSTTYVKSTSN